MPSTQNNTGVKIAYLGEACPKSLHWQYLFNGIQGYAAPLEVGIRLELSIWAMSNLVPSSRDFEKQRHVDRRDGK